MEFIGGNAFDRKYIMCPLKYCLSPSTSRDVCSCIVEDTILEEHERQTHSQIDEWTDSRK